jgi:hypothetical protein
MDEYPQITEDGDVDLDQFDLLDDVPWPPPNLSAIDLPLAFLHAKIKASATVPGGLSEAQYDRLPRDQPARPFQLKLPTSFESFKPEPLDFFKLFFTDETIDILVENTNLYAQLAKAETGRRGTSRHWTPVNRHDISVYLALTIHIGLNGGQSIESFWNFNSSTYHQPMRTITYFRYT